MIAFTVGMMHWDNNKQLRIITVYAGILLALTFLGGYAGTHLKNHILIEYIRKSCLYLSIFFETTIFYVFISHKLVDTRFKIICKILFALFLVLFLYLVPDKFFHNEVEVNSVIVLKSIFLIIPCLFYFYELFNANSLNLNEDATFWIITGILSYDSCRIPISLIAKYVEKNISVDSFSVILSLNYFLYCIRFLLFLKAYSCKEKAAA